MLRAGTDSQYKGTGQGNVVVQGADLLAKDQVSIQGNSVDLHAITDSHAQNHNFSRCHTLR